MTRTLVLGGWALVVAALVAAEVASFATGRRTGRLVDVLGALTSRPWQRVVVVLGWAWLGWHFFAR